MGKKKTAKKEEAVEPPPEDTAAAPSKDDVKEKKEPPAAPASEESTEPKDPTFRDEKKETDSPSTLAKAVHTDAIKMQQIAKLKILLEQKVSAHASLVKHMSEKKNVSANYLLQCDAIASWSQCPPLAAAASAFPAVFARFYRPHPATLSPAAPQRAQVAHTLLQTRLEH